MERPFRPSKGESIPETSEKQESQPDFETGASKTPEKIREGELTLMAAKKQPEAKLAHVTEAANRNEAVERLYELRHEVKDKAKPQAAVPVGDVLADTASRQPGLASMTPPQVAPPLPNSVLESREEPSAAPAKKRHGSMYRMAVKYGFATAIIIILSIEIYLLLKG